MKPRRVIFVSDYAANYGGNFLTSSKYLSQFLKDKGIESTYLFPVQAKEKSWRNDFQEFKVYYVDFNSAELYQYLNNIVQSNDIVYLNFLKRKHLLQIRRLKKKFKKQIKVIYHERMDLHFNYPKILKPLYNFYFKTLFKDFQFIANSPNVRKRILEKFGKRKSIVAENGIALSRLGGESSCEKLNKNIVIFGTDYYRKAVDISIKAIQASVLKEIITLKIIVHNISETEKRISEEFGKVPSFVKICPTNANVKEVYDDSFLFLSPSRHEAFGNAVVEASYCGTQVIASDVPGQNTLKSIPYVKWVRPDSVSALTNAIEKAYDYPSINSKKRLNEIRKVIEQKYSLQSWTDKIYKFFVE